MQMFKNHIVCDLVKLNILGLPSTRLYQIINFMYFNFLESTIKKNIKFPLSVCLSLILLLYQFLKNMIYEITHIWLDMIVHIQIKLDFK